MSVISGEAHISNFDAMFIYGTLALSLWETGYKWVAVCSASIVLMHGAMALKVLLAP